MKISTGAPALKGPEVKNKKPQMALDIAFQTRRSGLKVYVERPGEGPKVKPGSRLKVHYEGWLSKDYSRFDSSRAKRRPFEFTHGKGEVIRGWDEALEGVRAGTKLQLIIPAKLAYGEKGIPNLGIPPNAELIFKVEVLKVS